MDAHDEMISALRGDEPLMAQSRAEGANLTDVLSDPFEAVLDTIDRMKEYGLTSSTRQIGFATVNGKKAQVQICVDTNSMNWIVSDNSEVRRFAEGESGGAKRNEP